MRYFAHVRARDDRAFVELGMLDLDLVVGSSKRKDRSIDGLLSLNEIGQLVRLGYEVTVTETEQGRSRSRDILSFDEWRESVS